MKPLIGIEESANYNKFKIEIIYSTNSQILDVLHSITLCWLHDP